MIPHFFLSVHHLGLLGWIAEVGVKNEHIQKPQSQNKQEHKTDTKYTRQVCGKFSGNENPIKTVCLRERSSIIWSILDNSRPYKCRGRFG